MIEKPFQGHLQVDEMAGYVDGSVADDERAVMQTHLAACADCRAEVVDVSRVLATLPPARWVRARAWVLAAAAVVAVLLAVPPTRRGRTGPVHREAPVTMTVAPRPVTPRGPVASAKALVWWTVPYADGYRVRLFDSAGVVIREWETADTVARLAPSITLRPGRPYYWKVEARTGFDRWVASDLVEFTVGRGSER
jgi:anti-sigma factor RsiW